MPEPGHGAAAFRRPGRGDGRLVLGVGAGLARRWHLNPAVVRAAFLVTLLPFGAGLLLYPALALVMPGDGADATSAGWRGELGRTLTQALVVLAALLVVALIAAIAVGFALFGLASVALVLATASLTAIIFVHHPRVTWSLGLVTLALALPAAVVALTDVQVARQFQVLVAQPVSPQTVDPAGYRAGTGPLLVDLRDFDAPARSSTTIRARADLRTLVVALPRDRCFNLVVDHRLSSSWLSALLDQRRPTTFIDGSLVRRPSTRSRRAAQSGAPYSLLAYGAPVAGPIGRFRRTVADPDAPTLHLVLASGRSQMIVRDYPNTVQPLRDPLWPSSVSAPEFVGASPALDARLQARERAKLTLGTIAQARPDDRRRDRAAAADVVGQLLRNGDLSTYQRLISAAQARAFWPRVQADRWAGSCASDKIARSLAGRIAAQDPQHELAEGILADVRASPGTRRDRNVAAVARVLAVPGPGATTPATGTTP